MPILPYNPAINATSNIFKTHLNYIKCIKHLTSNLSISVNINATGALDKSRYTKFEKLSDITKLSAEELDTVIEILRNIDKTFRTYGKRAIGFGNYLTKVIKRRREY